MDSRNDEQDDARGRIEAEAADWWTRLELETADREAFNRWREANPANAVAYARLQASWERLLEAGAEVPGPNELAPTRMSRRHLIRSMGLGIVAVTVGGIFATSRALAWDHARTGVGELRRITLPDASVLELNTDTAVAWRFTSHARDIRLDRGEISVALVAGAPATLLAESTKLALSEGQFNARLTGTKVGLIVLRGVVIADTIRQVGAETPNRTASIRVEPGQAAELSPAGRTVQSMTEEARAMLTAWQSGDIVFQNERLQAAVDEYNRYLTKQIVVDADLRDLRVGGRFTTSDPTAFLRAVAIGLGVGVQTTSDAYRIVSKN